MGVILRSTVDNGILYVHVFKLYSVEKRNSFSTFGLKCD